MSAPTCDASRAELIAELDAWGDRVRLERQTPRLVAEPCDRGRALRVWCPFCRRWHYHGAAAFGHRAAHCRRPDSPYMITGYVLVRTEPTERETP